MSQVDTVVERVVAPSAGTVDMKLEVVVIPVSDVDRAKRFYGDLGWRLDADFVVSDAFRAVQFTPPGSSCSIHFGTGITSAAPGSAQRTLSRRVRHRGGPRRARRSRCRGQRRVPPVPVRGKPPPAAWIRRGAATPPTPRSATRTATAGCCRRSPPDCPDAWTRTRRASPRLPSSPARSAARRPRMASTRRAPASGMRTGRTGTPRTWWRSRPASRCRHEQRPRRHRRRRRAGRPRAAQQGRSVERQASLDGLCAALAPAAAPGSARS